MCADCTRRQDWPQREAAARVLAATLRQMFDEAYRMKLLADEFEVRISPEFLNAASCALRLPASGFTFDGAPVVADGRLRGMSARMVIRPPLVDLDVRVEHPAGSALDPCARHGRTGPGPCPDCDGPPWAHRLGMAPSSAWSFRARAALGLAPIGEEGPDADVQP